MQNAVLSAGIATFAAIGASGALSISGVNVKFTAIWRTVEIMQIVNFIAFLNIKMTYEFRSFLKS